MSEDFDNQSEEDEPEEEFEESLPVEEIDSGVDADITDDDKLWAFLAYVFTPLIPVVLMLMEDKKERPFIKAHNAQALAWGLLNLIAGGILSPFTCGLSFLIIWAIGVYWGWQAYQGKSVTIPVVTDFVKGQGWA